MLNLKWISLHHKLPLTCTQGAKEHFSLFASEELSTLSSTYTSCGTSALQRANRRWILSYPLPEGTEFGFPDG